MATKTTNQVQDAFESVKADIRGLKAISVVEVDTGLAIDSMIVDQTFDLDAAGAYNAEVLKAKIKAKNAMGMSDERIEVIIIELNSQIHIIQPTPNEKFLLYMAADKSSTNLGIARKAVKSAASAIETELN
jgi:hypothetical protein